MSALGGLDRLLWVYGLNRSRGRRSGQACGGALRLRLCDVGDRGNPPRLHKDDSGRLVSLVVLFRLGAEHPALGRLLPHLPAPGAAERIVDAPVDAAQFLPASRAYYRYEGSLTAPPCTEGVLWIVMKQPLELSAAQLARLRQAFPGQSRPVQPLHGRVVLEGP